MDPVQRFKDTRKAKRGGKTPLTPVTFLSGNSNKKEGLKKMKK